MKNCVEFTMDYNGENYEKYYKSHDWECVKEKEIFLYVCKKCKAVRQHFSGTIDFHFGCKLVGFEDLE